MRLAWFTNLAPTYRLPIWQELARLLDLTILLAAKTEPGRFWEIPTGRDYELQVLRTRRLTRGESHHYFLLPGALNRVSVPDALIIGGWESPAAWSLMRWGKRRDVRIVGFNESTPVSHKFRSGPIAEARRRFFMSCDSVLTVGRSSRQAMANLGVPDDRIFTAFNCVDHQAFYSGSRRLRRSHPLSSSGHRFIYVGRLLELKCVLELIESFSRIAHPQDELLIVGDGVLRGECEKVAREMTTGKISFAGHLTGQALLQAYADAHTLILPSRQEVWGLVVNEALSSGLHVVVSRHAGVAASVDGMRGVYPCDPHVDSIAHAMSMSRSTWSGYLTAPEILRYGPEDFAGEVISAMTAEASHRD